MATTPAKTPAKATPKQDPKPTTPPAETAVSEQSKGKATLRDVLDHVNTNGSKWGVHDAATIKDITAIFQSDPDSPLTGTPLANAVRSACQDLKYVYTPRPRASVAGLSAEDFAPADIAADSIAAVASMITSKARSELQMKVDDQIIAVYDRWVLANKPALDSKDAPWQGNYVAPENVAGIKKLLDSAARHHKVRIVYGKTQTGVTHKNREGLTLITWVVGDLRPRKTNKEK